MTKPKLFFLSAVLTALLAVGGGMAWGADLPSQVEVWNNVRQGGFGPVITGSFWNEYTAIEKVELSKDRRFLFVVYRTPSMAMFMTNPPTEAPDSIFRHVYGVEDGRIVFLGQQGAEVTPKKVEPESYHFEPWE
jgi:hypothetical protein